MAQKESGSVPLPLLEKVQESKVWRNRKMASIKNKTPEFSTEGTSSTANWMKR
jgi:hypothetical protein